MREREKKEWGRLLGLCKDNRQGTYSKTFQCRVAVVVAGDNAEKKWIREGILEADAGAYNDIPLLPSSTTNTNDDYAASSHFHIHTKTLIISFYYSFSLCTYRAQAAADCVE